jgi:pantoate--beta-alanine ligase
VATVVAKLFNIIEPQVAFFGQKDAAQLAVIRRMVRDLNFPIEIIAGAIVREPDGLAMSSRNAYLTPEERGRALVLQRSLRRAEAEFQSGQRSAAKLISAALEVLASEPQVAVDYLEVVSPDTLESIERITQTALLAIAARVGSTRLIDNVLLIP